MGTSGLPRSLHSPQVAPAAQLIHTIEMLCGPSSSLGVSERTFFFFVFIQIWTGAEINSWMRLVGAELQFAIG